MTSREVVARHQSAGRHFEAAGVRSFVLEEAPRGGGGEPVVCVHGVPSSSFLYRKVLAELAARGFSGVAFDTMVEVDTFRRPWSMEPFARRALGEAYLATLSKPAFRLLFNLQGLGDRAATPREEVFAYVDLLKRDDRGRAFLRIMRSFERTREKRDLYVSALRDAPYPVQVVWGADDPALPIERHGEDVRRAAGLDQVHALPAKHFLQEDQAPAIAERVAALA